MNPNLQILAFLFLTLVLFFLSRKSTSLLFQFLINHFGSKRLSYAILAIIYLPGTILHELSHFLMANILFLKVHDISIFPEVDENQLKLGKVIFEKKDFVRGILVGVAPIFVGLSFLLWLSSLGVGSSENIFYKALLFYLIFVISTSMFSSKQDLVDLVYLIPAILVFVFVIYLFGIDLGFFYHIFQSLEGGLKFLYALNNYLGLSILIHLSVLLIVKVYLKLFK